jgi:hypothetical protein
VITAEKLERARTIIGKGLQCGQIYSTTDNVLYQRYRAEIGCSARVQDSRKSARFPDVAPRLKGDWICHEREGNRMPFDGTSRPSREPYRDGRSGSWKVQLALRGWRPVQYCERSRKWKWHVVAFLRLLAYPRFGG